MRTTIKQERMQELLGFIDKGQLMKFYKSREWMQLRQKALMRDNYECQLCKAAGRYHKAENVHHMKEVKTHPHLSLNLGNLQCLCIKCHNDVHDRLEATRANKFMNDERW
ncbi:HNH endonuclease [Lysinibacillus sp. NPDC048646]|uniref:HNH endonuclease n=1 Tax=Lysinibacillus sp. NPDC048646 TaxID=3390574 RepID=UPI003D07B8AA